MVNSKMNDGHPGSCLPVLRGILFLLGFILFNALLGHFFLEKILNDSRTGLIDRQFHQNEAFIRVLAMGDSHVATGFDPRIFNDRQAFNFALYGENYIYNYYKIEYILKRHLPELKVIILPVDLHSFSAWRADRHLFDFYWVKYVDYWDMGVNLNALFTFVSKYIKGKYFPYIGEFEVMFNLEKQKRPKVPVIRPQIFQGYVVKTGVFNINRLQRARQRVRLHFGKHRYYDHSLVFYFKKILKLCGEQDINLVLVRFPVTRIYYQLVAKKIPVKDTFDRILSLTRSYPKVRVMDKIDFFFGDDVRNFDDPDHLNQRGARDFTRHLKSELQKLGLLAE